MMKFSTTTLALAAAVAASEQYTPEHETKSYGEKCPNMEHLEHFDTPDYQAMSAACKKELIWKRVTDSDTVNRYFVATEFTKMFSEDPNMLYDTVSDTIPLNQLRRIYPRGVTTEVEFIPAANSPYTGIFKGAKHAVMRIAEFSLTTPELPKSAPGQSIKFLRDGMSSGNIHTAFAFDGQPSFNFFKNRWSNILREPENVCLRETYAKWLADATNHIGCNSLMELAQFDQYGKEEYEPHWPFMVEMEPYDVYGWTDKYQNDFQDQLTLIHPDTALFKVQAYDSPPEHGGKDHLAGWIVSRSKTVTSLWGDKNLFFQQRRYEDDILYRPQYAQWLQYWNGGKYSVSPLANPAPKQKCPFFFLFEEAGLA